MRLRVGCEFDFYADAAVPMLMLVRAQPDGEHETLYESRWTDPEIPVTEYIDAYGNRCWRFVAPPGRLRVRYDALVAISGEPDPVVPDALLVAVEDLPDETLVFTLASRYIQSDLLVATAWELFGSTPPTWQRVQAVCDWVHANIRYETGSSDPTITALDVFQRRVGVCRDFALLATAFCRALNIPARYTFGYFPDIAVEPPDVPMDFHAWFEAYLGDRWYPFDARHNVPRIGRVVIGRGRDAVDVALTTQYGASQLNMMTVWADEVGDSLTLPPRDDDADELEAAEAITPSLAS
ncbi:MAG TPA: transglutaminase family protein [Chloroflexota bacterium]|jgi:transglutaminase-like putative cysteine protease|nr:transglutaminase family protein [Chloroflexota bacterium]